MTTIDGLTGELSDLGRAIGVIDDNGALDSEWLANPLARLESILSDSSQREALLRLLDALLPPASIPGVPAGERWHPLLGAQPRGNVYLTIREQEAGVLVGLAADLGSTPSAATQARLRAQIPLVRAGATVSAVAGTTDGPLTFHLRVDVAWDRNLTTVPPQPIGLRAIVVEAAFDPSPAMRVVLEGLQLDERPAVDRTLDVAQLGRDAPELIAGLLRQVLARSTASPEIALLSDHLLGLFGLSGSSVPPFPFAQLADGPVALQRWLDAMLVVGSPTAGVRTWLTHLAALIGTSSTPSGTGTLDDPWRIELLSLGADAELALTLSRRSGTARFGLLAEARRDVGGGAGPVMSLQGAMAIVDLPLAGTSRARPLPDGAVRIHVDGGGSPLIDNSGTLRVGALDAGVTWNGSSLEPLLALIDVKFGGATYPRLDLTNVDSVVDAAANGVLATIVAALGPGVGRHLAAIAGLTAASDPADRDQPLAGWPHQIQASKLVTNPAAAIAAYHRAVLLSATHGWDFLLGDVAALLGITDAVAGSGTRADPWRVPLAAPASGVALDVVAWNDAASSPGTDPQKLRLGLRLVAGAPPLQFAWLAELLAFDLPASGSGDVSFVGTQHARLDLAPAFDGPLFGDVNATVDALVAEASWRPGTPITWSARAENVRILAPEGDVSVAALTFPPAGGFDVGSLAATASALGIGVPQLEILIRLLLARLATAVGDEGRVISAVLGLHRQMPGFGVDAPTLDDATQPGRMLRDPIAAVRGLLRRATDTVRADGNAHLATLLAWIDALLRGELPSLADEEGTVELPAAIVGAGTYDDPWQLPWLSSDSSGPHLELWLEPDGPPSAWANGVASRVSASTDFGELTAALRSAAAFSKPLSSTLRGRDTAIVASALDALDAHLIGGDGVVPIDSQSPNIFGWDHGEQLAAPHHLLPSDPDAIAQILTRVDTLAGGVGSPRVVLLLGPSFLSAGAWSDLLASPQRHGTAESGAHFELRTPGIDPLTISLDDVTAVSDYYTANLADDGGGDLSRLVTQLDRIASRLTVLRGDVPITLVAHSTAGIAARAYAATHQSRVKGLITLGTPHVGARLGFLTDALVGDGVRVAHTARAGASSTSPLRKALDHLVDGIDGYVVDAPSTPARKQPYPFASFNAIGPFDTGDVPVLALGSVLTESLLDVLKSDAATFATAAGTGDRKSTHLAGGIALPMEIPAAADGGATADARFRQGLFQIALDPAAPSPTRAPHAIRAEIRIHRGDDWLLGGPSTFPRTGEITDPRLAFVDARARSISLGLDITPAGGTSTKAAAVTFLEVTHGAFRGPTHDRLDASSPLAHAVVGEALDTLARESASTSSMKALLDALGDIGLIVTDAHGATGLSADAWAALTTDPLGALGAAIPRALATPDGWFGLRGDAQGPWTWTPPGSPIELVVTRAAHGPWTVALRSTGASASAGGASTLRLGLDLASGLPSFGATGGVELGLGPLTSRFDLDARTLDVSAPPWLSAVRLVPAPSDADLHSALNEALPRLLFSGALSAALSAVVPSARAEAIEQFLRSSGEYLQSADSLGRADGPGFDGERVASLLRTINNLAGFPAGDGLQLPGDLSIAASGAGTDADPLVLSLKTASPVGGVLSIDAGVRIDTLRHPTPRGTVTVETPLGGTWPHVGVRFGVDSSGLSLSVLPQGQPEIRILPSFSGIGALRGAAAALLPQVLDAVVGEFGSPSPTWLARLLDVASALQLYDDAGKFVGHTAQLQALLSPNWRDTFDASLRSGVANAVVALANAMSLPGSTTATNGLVTWSIPLGAPDQRVGVAVGWSGDDPQLRVIAERVSLGTGAMSVSASLAAGPAGLACSGSLGVLLGAVGVTATPTFAFALNTDADARFRARVLPLASSSSDGPLEIVLAPSLAINAGPDTALRLIDEWALPLIASAVIETERVQLSRQLWTDGPTVQEALVFANLLDAAGKLVAPLPSVGRIATGLLSGLATLPPVTVGTLEIGVAALDTRVGLRLGGHTDVRVGSHELSIRFGAPTSWTVPSGIDGGSPGADRGLELLLLRSDDADIGLDVGVRLAGVGIGIAGADGAKLLDTSLVRIGALRAYVFMDVETTPALRVDGLGAGAELIAFGLPLGAATSGNVGGNNPVASSLLRSDGGSGGGDARPVNPEVDVDVWYWQPPGNVGNPFHVRFGGEGGGATLWVPVHAGFGPLYVDQVGVTADSASASMLVDGGVKVAGLTAQVDDLTVRVPYEQIGDPSKWSLDLKGLALGFNAPGISISGALVKFDGPPIEYDGMLMVQLTKIGAIAVGSYAIVGSGAGEFASLAIFGGVFVPIGIPPIINITALGVGLGYNRRLVVPQDLNEIPSFFLIQALDRPEQIANDPMKALFSFRDAVPPSRGSLWLAAGLRGTTFEVINVTAVLYVALDRGLEVGLLGVARMAVPNDDTTLASVEVALKARFSEAEGLFSVQAQLTDNSWFISPDCQLTGGWAMLYWFRESQVLFTMGGYHPAFQRRPEFPEVPRLGYHWNYAGLVQLKGESYFAITNSAVMAGLRVEATYGASWIQLWFTGHADFLIVRHPFHYQASVGVEVGARVRIKVCFFKCVRITVSVSVGAELELQGPPLHGIAKIDLGVASIDIPFGDAAPPALPLMPWEPFKLKYLKGDDARTAPVSAQVAAGLMPSEPPGAKVAAGSLAEPWRIASEWTLRAETRMPARGFLFQADVPRSEGEMSTAVFGRYASLASVYAFDLAPMGVASHEIESMLRFVLYRKPEGGGNFAPLVPRGIAPPPADRTFLIDERMFRVRPIIGKVPEATYHYFPDLKPPAAANTLPVLLGLEVEGVAFMIHPSAVIPIAKLRDATNSRPLPFAHTPPVFADWRISGAEAELFATIAEGRTSRVLVNAFAQMLSGNGEFSARRTQAKLPEQGLPPVAARSLRTRRSAPPMLATLSLGLAMHPAEQPLPPEVKETAPRPPVALDSLRLRAVMQQRVAPTRAAAPTVRMTVERVAKAVHTRVAVRRVDVERDLLRRVAVPGAKLHAYARPDAARETRLPSTTISLRSGEIGATIGRGTLRRIEEIEKAAGGDSVAIRSGVTQLWEVPPKSKRRLVIWGGGTAEARRGSMAVRVTLLGASGTLISDAEYSGTHDVELELPDACAMVAVTGLGGNPTLFGRNGNGSGPGLVGAVTSRYAPGGATPNVGWELRQQVAQLSPSLLLGRGATILLSQRSAARNGAQSFGVGTTALADALRDQTAIETRLPVHTRVVGVLLDLDVGDVLSPDDLVVGVANGRFAGEPTRVEGGDRALLLYDVSPDVARRDVTWISVTVALRGGARVVGVVGLAGSAREWGKRMNGCIPEQLVPDDPLTADGEAQLRFVLA